MKTSLLVLLIIININILQVRSNKVRDLFSARRYHVIIENYISPSNISNVLKVHCASKDDDIGTHELAYNAHIEWSFQEKFLDLPPTTEICKWTVTDGGFYIEGESKDKFFLYRWDKK
ncbi:hypothetical protein HAX54_035454 [Datura stramonium]|uniref:S-protein homolog n=1 Tax=Datura stramonium TaxID=4076 RepID=A0ABS8SFD9_DATST|nr:hypothetical protein [Datura stramonium]